jgi:anti-sigma factor RsiW
MEGTMFCWRSRSRLSAWIDGELPPARARALVRHLEGCADCAARERELRGAWDEVGALPDPEAGAGDLWPGIERRLAHDSRPPVLEQRHRWLVPAAVAACAMLGVVGGTLFALRFAPRTPRAAETVRAVTTDDSFAEAFGDGPGETTVRGLFAGRPVPRVESTVPGEDAR